MKVKFLIQQHAHKGSITASCASLRLITQLHNSDTTAKSEIESLISNFLALTGTDYVKTHFKSDEVVNCPEGFVKLPIDLWCCKLTGAACDLQAQVFLNDRDKFISSCTAPETKKNGIFTAISDGRYKGFHHVVGRYLCPSCQNDSSFDYHYRFELTLITDILGNDDQDADPNILRTQIIRQGLPTNVLYCALCPDCALKTIQIIAPTIAQSLRIIELEFTPR
jgi:hypothetical protein